MENKNIITFLRLKTLKKRTMNLVNILVFLLKKGVEALDKLQDPWNINNQKVKGK